MKTVELIMGIIILLAITLAMWACLAVSDKDDEYEIPDDDRYSGLLEDDDDE